MKTEIDFDKFVTEALKEEPAYFLPTNFAERMAEKVQHKLIWKSSLWEYLMVAFLLVGIAVLIFAAYYFVNKESFSQIQSFMTKNTVGILSLVFIVNFILFADKVILRMLFSLKK